MCVHWVLQLSEQKKGYKLPRPIMGNSDLTRLINSDEIQSIVKAPKVRLHMLGPPGLEIHLRHLCNSEPRSAATVAAAEEPSSSVADWHRFMFDGSFV